jgi:ferrous iron transport protein A
MLPLGLLSEGEAAMVLQESSNRMNNRADILCRIEEMGFRAGKTVEMLNNEGKGPLLIRIDNARVAIARSLAMKVMVRRTN